MCRAVFMLLTEELQFYSRWFLRVEASSDAFTFWFHISRHREEGKPHTHRPFLSHNLYHTLECLIDQGNLPQNLYHSPVPWSWVQQGTMHILKASGSRSNVTLSYCTCNYFSKYHTFPGTLDFRVTINLENVNGCNQCWQFKCDVK